MAIYRNVAVDNDGDANNQVTASSANLDWIHVMNTSGAVAYVHVYDDAASGVTPGTTTPTATFAIPTAADRYIYIEESSQRGWTICASDAAAGSGSAPATVILNAGWG